MNKGDQSKPQTEIEQATKWNPTEPNANPRNPKLVDPAKVPQGPNVEPKRGP